MPLYFAFSKLQWIHRVEPALYDTWLLPDTEAGVLLTVNLFTLFDNEVQ
jgi:hypothetical protein